MRQGTKIFPDLIRISRYLAVFIFISHLFFVSPLESGTIEIEWDPPLTGQAAGYRVYYGTSSGNYQWAQDAGSATSAVLRDLEDCTMYYWAIKAYDSIGQESEEFSNEVSGWARPVVFYLDPESGQQGESLDITIHGSNFSPEPSVETDCTGIQAISASSLDCNTMSVTFQIDPESRELKAAAVGSCAVDVISEDMDRAYGNLQQAFTVTLNVSRLDVDSSGRIDGLDLNQFAPYVGFCEFDEGFEYQYDFDGDGWIDGDDLALLSAHFGLTL
jgi:hypothetical protein